MFQNEIRFFADIYGDSAVVTIQESPHLPKTLGRTAGDRPSLSALNHLFFVFFDQKLSIFKNSSPIFEPQSIKESFKSRFFKKVLLLIAFFKKISLLKLFTQNRKYLKSSKVSSSKLSIVVETPQRSQNQSFLKAQFSDSFVQSTIS